MSPESLQSIIVVLIGFAVAGLLASGYQLVTERPLSFRLLNGGAKPLTLLAVPVLTFAAPFVSARTSGTSFNIAVTSAPSTNPACFSYAIIN